MNANGNNSGNKPFTFPESEVSDVNALKEQLAAKTKGLVDYLLALAHRTIAALRQLGYHYELVEKSNATTNKSCIRNCSICKDVTDPPHDARAHKHQVDKQPFTPQELDNLKHRGRFDKYPPQEPTR